MFERELRELSFIPRFNIARCLRTQSVAEHSYYVMTYGMQIAEMLGMGHLAGDVARLASVHDVAEAATGDMPSPIKKAIRKRTGGAALDGIEHEYLWDRFPDTACWVDATLEVKQIVRVADALDAVLWCCTEEQMGNQTLGGGLTSQDLVDAREIPTREHIGANGVAQVVLVQLAKAWFDLDMVEAEKLMVLWRGVIEPAIIRHRYGQSRIFDFSREA